MKEPIVQFSLCRILLTTNGSDAVIETVVKLLGHVERGVGVMGQVPDRCEMHTDSLDGSPASTGDLFLCLYGCLCSGLSGSRIQNSSPKHRSHAPSPLSLVMWGRRFYVDELCLEPLRLSNVDPGLRLCFTPHNDSERAAL